MTGFAICLDPTDAENAAHAWDVPTRPPPDGAALVLMVDGFEGPLDWPLEMARARRIDLA